MQGTRRLIHDPLREIVKALKASDATWPGTTANIFTCFETKGFTDWYGRWFHPRLLAELVVRLVEERARSRYNRLGHLRAWASQSDVIKLNYMSQALSDFDIAITPEDFAWLKGKVG